MRSGGKNGERELNTARKMAPLSFFGSCSIFRAAKPTIPFLGPSLPRNRTETLATQASLHVDKGLLVDTNGTTFWEKPSTMQTCNGTNVNRTGRRKAPKACPKTCSRGVKKYQRDADMTLLNPTEDEKTPITCVNWLSRYAQNKIY